MVRYLGILCLMLIHTHGANAQDIDFEQCLSQLQERARNEKLSVQVIDEVLANLKPQPRVIELDRSQPEFTQTFANYLYQRVTPERIAQGKRILAQYDSFLSRLTREHGVPGRYLVAFWGMETSFGSYLGRMPTLDSLATLACDQRRSAFFTDELMQALALLERESLSPEDMRGSWAGAMGHTQFMPSAYRLHAIDGDGDGTILMPKPAWPTSARSVTGKSSVSASPTARLSLISTCRPRFWFRPVTRGRHSWCTRTSMSSWSGTAVNTTRWLSACWPIA